MNNRLHNHYKKILWAPIILKGMILGKVDFHSETGQRERFIANQNHKLNPNNKSSGFKGFKWFYLWQWNRNSVIITCPLWSFHRQVTVVDVVCHMAPPVTICSHLHTFWEIEMASASNTLNTLAVSPSPRSLASQQLQAKTYLTPLVGTATDSSSTSQQLSGVAPSWPSCREGEKYWNSKGVFFCMLMCVCVRMLRAYDWHWKARNLTPHSPPPF